MSDLAALLGAIALPHEAAADGEPRFSLDGPPVQCGEHAANGIALVFHELTTNAAKYGALTEAGGKIDITWQRDSEHLTLRWVERGGPPVEGPPDKQGFGSTLARNTVVGQFGGSLVYDWNPNGLLVTITLALDRVAV
jgi:two-component sensor histidine kinase